MAEESDNSDTVYNVKPTRKKKKSGGFQSMGLSYSVLKGVLRKGYKVPTPIQRKAIPLIVEGKDVVAMARTGSGKTAAFLLPMFERLKTHVANAGSRGLILSPTRELALQTFSFIKELGKFTSLKAAVILGGDSMEDQFSKIHENPDIIIATPGRLLHVVIEMDLKLSSIEYVVFDEADRLFEMGFREQLQEILSRLPDHRQTLLFSATLPNVLVDFVKAGLNDPILIRLDTEKKLSEHLKVSYISCRTNDKMAILLHLLKFVVKPGQLTVVFLATKHHVEYAREILARANIPCSYIYSSLDPTARKINLAKFKMHKVCILLVTDIAARGIDIPFLDNVINYNFPAKPKLFVHRVGRVARAGRSGTAYSLVAPDETAFLLDLHLFLGQPINLTGDSTDNADGVYGSVPQNVIDEEYDLLSAWHESSVDMRNMKQVCENAYKQYIKSRPLPSSESAKRIKEILQTPPKIHPLFKGTATVALEDDRVQLLENMKAYRPNTTIFEIGATGKSQASEIMRSKRKHHCKIIKRSCDPSFVKLQLQINKKKSNNNPPKSESAKVSFTAKLGERDQILEITHHKSVKKRKYKENFKDEAFYLSYRPADHYTEKGLEIEKSFNRQITDAVLDFATDDADKIQSQKKSLKWDRKKKKFIRDDQKNDPKRKKIKTESGAWISASYKSDHYKQWKEKCKFDQRKEAQEDEETEFGKERKGMKAALQKNKQKQKRYRPELKTKDQILKARKKKSGLLFHQKQQHAQRAKRNGKKKK